MTNQEIMSKWFFIGRIIESCSCGTTIYIKTNAGAYKVESGDETIRTIFQNGHNCLYSKNDLKPCKYPF